MSTKPKADDADIAAAVFKARPLAPMDRVKEAKSFFGSMKGTVLEYDRPLDPIDGDYNIDQQP